MSKSKTFPIGRDSRTGRLESVKKAESHKSTSTVERMPKPGHGDSDKPKGKSR